MRTLPEQRSLLGTDRVSMIIDYGISCSKQENWTGFVFKAGETFGGGGGGGGSKGPVSSTCEYSA